jgi:phage shock protein B
MSDGQLAIWLSLMPENMPVIIVAGLVVLAAVWMVLHDLHELTAARGPSRRDDAAIAAMHETMSRMENRMKALERLLDAEAPAWRETEWQGGWHGLG